LNFQPVWISRLFSALSEEIAAVIQQRSQKFEVRPFPGMADLTFGDPERLMQVFRNVLTNAIKFTPDGGEIIVHGRKLPGFTEVIVSDNGIGIDTEDVQIIFDKFVRLGNTALHSSSKTKFKGGGPGLGLHIAKGIIESHGGAIWAESGGHDETACPGSTFHILVPMRTSPPDTKMAKLFAPLINKTSSEKGDH
jgi:signal transduction histidine kinase